MFLSVNSVSFTLPCHPGNTRAMQSKSQRPSEDCGEFGLGYVNFFCVFCEVSELSWKTVTMAVARPKVSDFVWQLLDLDKVEP